MTKGLNSCLCGEGNIIPCMDNEHMYYVYCAKCNKKTQKWTTIELAANEWNGNLGEVKTIEGEDYVSKT